jgi:MFS family permease
MSAGKLGHRFWRLWSASAASTVGDGMLVVALPLLATRLTTDARLIAAVVVAEQLPLLLLSIPAGTIADRRPYRRVMVGSDVVRGVIVSLIAILLLIDQLTITNLLVGAFGLGLFRPLFDAASHRALPCVVDDALLDRANGYMEATLSAGDEVGGRALGGLLFSLAPAVPLIGDAISFAASALVLRSLPADDPSVEPMGPRSSIRADMAAGVRWFVRSRLIRLLALVVAGLATAESMVAAMLVLIAKQRFHLSDRGFGVFLAGTSIGGIVAGIIAGPIIERIGQSRALLAGFAIVAASYFWMWATASAVVAAMVMSVQVGAITIAKVVIITIRQRTIPRALIGRVSTVISTFTSGAQPIGSLLGGFVAYRYGPRSTLLVAGVISAVMLVVGGPLIVGRLRTPTVVDA